MSEDRDLRDWGGYQPETQKALRFVKTLAGEGTAKQVAGAIAQEYTKREEPKPGQVRKTARRKKRLSDDEYEVAVEEYVAAFRVRHPEIDDNRAQHMIRMSCWLHKHLEPGWIL